MPVRDGTIFGMPCSPQVPGRPAKCLKEFDADHLSRSPNKFVAEGWDPEVRPARVVRNRRPLADFQPRLVLPSAFSALPAFKYGGATIPQEPDRKFGRSWYYFVHRNLVDTLQTMVA